MPESNQGTLPEAMTDFNDTIKALVQPATVGGAGLFASGQIVGGKYKILSLLGQGGMGSVYRVLQVFLNKELALKVIDTRAVVDDTQIRRFQVEARAANSLNHPNLVKVHDFGLLDNDEPYLVMDLVDGETLADFVKERGPLVPEQALAIFEQACLGLAYAHEQSIVHRDIKPSNIMLVNNVPLGAEGSVKIVDFGIAKLGSADGGEIQSLTRTGEVFGSPFYMSPEQCSGEAVDHRADVYSLGCTLFESLTGTPPHVGPNALRTMMLHQSAPVPLLKEASMGGDFSPALEDIVQKMLAKAPHQRYQDLSAAAADLRNAAGSNSHLVVLKTQVKGRRQAAKIITITLKKLSLMLAASSCLSICATAVAMVIWSDCFKRAESFVRSFPVKGSDLRRLDEKPMIQGKENEVVGHSFEITHSHESSKARTMYEKAGPIVSHVDAATRKKTITFPDFPFGTVSNRTRTLACGEGDSQPWEQKAMGIVEVPVGCPLTLRVGGVLNPEPIESPATFKKIGRDEFVDLVLDHSLATGMFGVSTGDWSEPDNVAEILQIASGWKKAYSACFDRVVVNEKALAALQEWPHLRWLQLKSPGPIATKLAAMPFITQLESVNMCDFSKSCDPVLFALSNSKKLNRLAVEGSPFSSDALASLAACPNLQFIDLKMKRVDKPTLQALSKLKHIKGLFFRETPLTADQLEMVLRAYPWLKVIYVSRGFAENADLLRESDHRLKFL